MTLVGMRDCEAEAAMKRWHAHEDKHHCGFDVKCVLNDRLWRNYTELRDLAIEAAAVAEEGART